MIRLGLTKREERHSKIIWLSANNLTEAELNDVNYYKTGDKYKNIKIRVRDLRNTVSESIILRNSFRVVNNNGKIEYHNHVRELLADFADYYIVVETNNNMYYVGTKEDFHYIPEAEITEQYIYVDRFKIKLHSNNAIQMFIQRT